MQYNFGIIGENGVIEGVTVTTSFIPDMDEHKLFRACDNGEDFDIVLRKMDEREASWSREQAAKRYASQGAEETRLFPKV